MASTRLRKTFHYPADDSDEDDTPATLDEEEQEKFIERLRREDEERNELYKRILLALPILAILSFIPTLVTSSIYKARLISLLSVTSLAATAYTLFFVPNTQSDDLSKLSSLMRPESGPLKRYIEPANGVLSLLLGCNAIMYRDRRGVHETFWLLNLLPIVAFSIITLARRLMIEVDVGGLEKLKYGYKGA